MGSSSQEIRKPIVDRVRDRDTGHLGHKRGMPDSIEGFTKSTGNYVDIRIAFKQISNRLKNRIRAAVVELVGLKAN